MKNVAKLIIVCGDEYLMMYRNNHPVFGDDPDIPGGTGEGEETSLETMIREVNEEIGVTVKADDARELFSGTDFSTHGTHYSLFMTHLDEKPTIVISWEHTGYEWVSRDEFIKQCKAANDTYMQMVGTALGSQAR